MPIANVIRVSVLGAMPGGEVWSVNPVFQIGGGSTSENVSDAQATAMATAMAATPIPAQLLGCWSGNTTYTGVRVEARRWNGELATQAEGIRGTPLPGIGTVSHPYQTSVVASLRTAGFGPRSRGRLYWPLTGLALNGANLRIPTSALDSIADGTAAYLAGLTTAIEDQLTNDCHLAVWSRTNASTQWVTSIQVGDVVDTQRRRRDSLIESVYTRSYP